MKQTPSAKRVPRVRYLAVWGAKRLWAIWILFRNGERFPEGHLRPDKSAGVPGTSRGAEIKSVEEEHRALELCEALGISSQYMIMFFHPEATLFFLIRLGGEGYRASDRRTDGVDDTEFRSNVVVRVEGIQAGIVEERFFWIVVFDRGLGEVCLKCGIMPLRDRKTLHIHEEIRKPYNR